MIDYKDFHLSIENLKKFIQEQDKMNAVLKVISPSGTGVCEFGNQFIDDYIKLLELAVNDQCNWVSWFVFENDFGKKKLSAKPANGKWHKITNDKLLYDVCLKGEIQR